MNVSTDDWPIDGTVGYEFLAKVNRLWMDDQRTDALTATYADFTGHSGEFRQIGAGKKTRNRRDRRFPRLTSELADTALEIAQADWRTRDLSPRQLREALEEIDHRAADLPNLSNCQCAA